MNFKETFFMEASKALRKEYAALTVVKKTCLNCAKPLVTGRTDKKYCNDTCKNEYSNKLNSAVNNLVRNTNNALGKNRRILEKLIAGQPNNKVTKLAFLMEGFQFQFHTQTSVNSKGNTYFFCYDYGYMQLEDNLFLIIRNK